jgi:integrase
LRVSGSGRFSAPSGKLRPATIQAALDTLRRKGSQRRPSKATARRAGRLRDWTSPDACFADLNLRGSHDPRHTFATWLEDAAIPSRVIDEVMEHAGGRHPEHGIRMGRVYRETTPEMVARVVAAIDARLAVVLEVATRKPPAERADGPSMRRRAAAL